MWTVAFGQIIVEANLSEKKSVYTHTQKCERTKFTIKQAFDFQSENELVFTTTFLKLTFVIVYKHSYSMRRPTGDLKVAILRSVNMYWYRSAEWPWINFFLFPLVCIYFAKKHIKLN